MVLFGHHMNALVEVEIMGQPFPTGPMEHGIAFGVTTLALLLIVYGAYAGLRDIVRWRRRKAHA